MKLRGCEWGGVQVGNIAAKDGLGRINTRVRVPLLKPIGFGTGVQLVRYEVPPCNPARFESFQRMSLNDLAGVSLASTYAL